LSRDSQRVTGATKKLTKYATEFVFLKNTMVTKNICFVYSQTYIDTTKLAPINISCK